MLSNVKPTTNTGITKHAGGSPSQQHLGPPSFSSPFHTRLRGISHLSFRERQLTQASGSWAADEAAAEAAAELPAEAVEAVAGAAGEGSEVVASSGDEGDMRRDAAGVRTAVIAKSETEAEERQ